MAVDAATVKKIGRLARIRVNEDEVEKYQAELNAILGFVEQLDEVDVTGVEPMTSVTPMQLRRREDKVTDGGYPEKIVANAPLSEDNFFMVGSQTSTARGSGSVAGSRLSSSTTLRGRGYAAVAESCVVTTGETPMSCHPRG